MTYMDGYHGTVMGAGTADKWPGVNSMDAALVQADLDLGNKSPTSDTQVVCVLRSIVPLKKTANGTVTLTINDGAGTPYTGLVFTFTADTLNFTPEPIELDLKLPRGLGFIKDSNNMDFLIVHEYLHKSPPTSPSYGSP